MWDTILDFRFFLISKVDIAHPVRGLGARNPVSTSLAFSYEKYMKKPGFSRLAIARQLSFHDNPHKKSEINSKLTA